MVRWLIFFPLIFVLSGCGDPEKAHTDLPPYSAVLVSNFVTACVSGGMQSEVFCKCVVDEIAKQLPEEAYIQQELDYVVSKKLPEGLEKAMVSSQRVCMGKHEPEAVKK